MAGSIYALGSAAMSPIATALAIDRAHPDRRGAAMATYSLGYQLGAGLGAAIWGAIIMAIVSVILDLLLNAVTRPRTATA